MLEDTFLALQNLKFLHSMKTGFFFSLSKNFFLEGL